MLGQDVVPKRRSETATSCCPGSSSGLSKNTSHTREPGHCTSGEIAIQKHSSPERATSVLWGVRQHYTTVDGQSSPERDRLRCALCVAQLHNRQNRQDEAMHEAAQLDLALPSGWPPPAHGALPWYQAPQRRLGAAGLMLFLQPLPRSLSGALSQHVVR